MAVSNEQINRSQLVLHLDSGQTRIVAESPELKCRDTQLDKQGLPMKGFHAGLTGFISYEHRLIASARKNEPGISPHASVGVLRRRIPKMVSMSLQGIDHFKIENIRYSPRKKQIEHVLTASKKSVVFKVLPSLDLTQRNNLGQFSNIESEFKKTQKFKRNINLHKGTAI